jgi:hypothetical protein
MSPWPSWRQRNELPYACFTKLTEERLEYRELPGRYLMLLTTLIDVRRHAEAGRRQEALPAVAGPRSLSTGQRQSYAHSGIVYRSRFDRPSSPASRPRRRLIHSILGGEHEHEPSWRHSAWDSRHRRFATASHGVSVRTGPRRSFGWVGLSRARRTFSSSRATPRPCRTHNQTGWSPPSRFRRGLTGW